MAMKQNSRKVKIHANLYSIKCFIFIILNNFHVFNIYLWWMVVNNCRLEEEHQQTAGVLYIRKLERLTVEGNVHLHGFAFLWGHCHNLKYMKIGKYTFCTVQGVGAGAARNRVIWLAP